MLEFIQENWGALIWGLFGITWIIVRLTPTKKDDVILKIIEKILQLLVPDRKKRSRTPRF